MPRSVTRAGLGMALAAGAPLGWLAVRWLGGADPGVELTTQPGLYLYMLLGTMAAFAIFGMLLGEREDRLLASNARLEDLSLTDSLTGLRNGRYFHARLDEEFSERERTGDSLAVVLLDLDHFKHINDTHGHPAGDDVLVSVGRAIASVSREGEVEARVGGEEFALLVPRSSGDAAREVAERVRRAIAAAEVSPDGDPTARLRVTASAGVATTAETAAATARDLYEAADAALYQAKQEGRDRTVVAGRR